MADQNSFVSGLGKIYGLFDGPATFVKKNIMDTFQKSYPYYHRQYPRVPTVDNCDFEDHVCIFEANDQYLRDRKVDKFITQILAERAKECYMREGSYDGFDKCRQLDDDYEKALTNYFIKYGELGQQANAIDAYMKQKHRMIWQRRHPDVDIVGLDKQAEVKAKIAEYQKRAKNDPNLG